MTMHKDDLEQVIREDLYREAEAIRKEVEASGAEHMPGEIKDDIRHKLRDRIDAYERDRVYAGLSEEDREALELGRKLQEERAASKTMRRRRTWKMFAASAAAVAVLLTAGVTSMGGSERIVSVIEQVIGGRKVVQVDSDEERKVSENEEEQKAYQEIKDTFGAEPVKLYNQKKGMKFVQVNLDEKLQVAEMLYEYDKKSLWYVISAGHYDSSFGWDMEDEVIDEEMIEVDGEKVEITAYRMKENGGIRCRAHFAYQKLEYFLMGDIEKEDFKLIVKKLYFL